MKTTYKYTFLALILSLWMVAVEGYAASTATVNATIASQQTVLSLPNFWAIQVQGSLNITLVGEQPKQTVTVTAPPPTQKKMSYVDATVNQGLLILRPTRYGNALDHPVNVKITLNRPISELRVNDGARVVATDIGHPELNVWLSDQAELKLQGHQVALQNIHMKGEHDHLWIENIHTSRLGVRAKGSGKIELSGNVSVLDARLSDTVVLYAHTLYAKNVYITSENAALAFICPADTLYGFATGHSDIYYYHHDPAPLVRDTHISGNVFKMTP